MITQLDKQKQRVQTEVEQHTITTPGNEECSINYKKIENTPFTVVENKGEYRILIGNNLAAEQVYKSYKEAIERIEQKDWELS